MSGNSISVSVVRKMEKHKSVFLAPLPRGLDPERTFAFCLNLAKDTKLAECTEQSILDSIHRIVKLGLEPDPLAGEAYIIPRNIKVGNQKVRMATFQAGYRGLIKLARRSNTISDIHAEVVYETELFTRTLGTLRQVLHEPPIERDETKAIIAAYATWVDLASGRVNFQVIGRKRIDRARAMNTYDGKPSGPWRDDESAMARKTAIVDASKFWTLSAELSEAVAADEHAQRGEPIPPTLPPEINVTNVTPVVSELDDFDQLLQASEDELTPALEGE
jgi:recombination protein RecT